MSARERTVEDTFNILCLDGGGMRGVFAASFIASIEKLLDPRVADSVDLIVGTSTGGLIALGLAAGRTGEQMLDLYRSSGDEIFTGSWQGRRLVRPKYSRSGLDAVLQREFGDLVMRELSTPVCVASYELISGQPRVFKTAHADDLVWGHDQLVWKVAAATSAAPTYFAPVQFTPADAHIDGGVWANNPSMVAITEAVRRFGRTLDSVRLLSVGANAPPATVKSFRAACRMGLPQWAAPALALLQSGPLQGNHFQAQHLLGPDHYLRVGDRADSLQPVALDDVAAAQPLAALGHRAALHNHGRVASLFGLNRRVHVS